MQKKAEYDFQPAYLVVEVQLTLKHQVSKELDFICLIIIAQVYWQQFMSLD